jgi:FixJ family two-component response regulator
MGHNVQIPQAYLQVDDRLDRAVISEALQEFGFRVRPLADLLPERLGNAASDIVVIGSDDRSFAVACERFLLIGGALPVVSCAREMDALWVAEAVHLGISSFVHCPPAPGELQRAVAFALSRRADAVRHYEVLVARRVLAGLTPRQLQIVGGLFRGLTNKQLATEFAISERTVEVHRARVIDKMDVGNTAGLIRLVALAGPDHLVDRRSSRDPRERQGSSVPFMLRPRSAVRLDSALPTAMQDELVAR